MNRFQLHHQELIRFGYSCFDRIILNGMIPAFQHAECGGTIRWFLQTQRRAQVNHAYFTKISGEYHDRVTRYSQNAGIAIVEPDKVKAALGVGEDLRREQLVEPHFQNLGSRHGVAVILKAREPERIAWHFSKSNRIGVERHYINVYYF